MVQLPTKDAAATSKKPTPAISDMNRNIGLLAVVCACTISGLAGVYFEKVLKGSKNTLWALNLQLSFFSIFPALLLGVLWKDGAQILDKGFFYGYNYVVWAAILAQAAGGLIVALCVAYADNIMKNFATSVSILISAVASVYLFQFDLSANFVLGAIVVLFATYLYSLADKILAPSSDVAELEKTTVIEDLEYRQRLLEVPNTRVSGERGPIDRLSVEAGRRVSGETR